MDTYGIAFSLTSCLGLAERAVVFPGFVTFEVRRTGEDAVFIWLVRFGDVTLECVVIVGDTGWDGMLLADRFGGALCVVVF